MKTRLLIIVGVVIVGVLITFTIQSQPISYADSIFDSCYDDDECTIDRLYEISQNNSTQTVLLTIDELVDLYVPFLDWDYFMTCHMT